MDIKTQLINAALIARKKAYAPYSHYLVGAAVLGPSGNIYTGQSCTVLESISAYGI